MTGCCVPNCSNSTEKGFSLKCFPSDLQQRTIWRRNINNHSSKWILTKNSYVCEVHFSAEMWEKVRVDGKKKLKANATPTNFPSKNSKNIPAIERNEHVIQEKCTTQSILDVPSTSSKHLLEDIDTVNDRKRLRKENEINIPIDGSKTLADDTTKKLRRKPANRKLNKTSIQRNQQRHQTIPIQILQQMFNEDQIEYLKAKYEGRHIYKWTDATIKKALRLRHACGDNGYRELLNQSYPLPSPRTLRRRLECISFKDGICDEVFNLLRDKVSNFSDERLNDCMICVDEMSLTPGEQIDPCTNKTIGYATIPDKFGLKPHAAHGLVFMICGIFTRWKQIVAYYYTPNGFNGATLKEIILNIIAKGELIGLKIHSVTSDMGAANQSMWKAFGNISATKHTTIKNSIPHPEDNNRKLFFFADAPHLLKNLRTALVNNKIITLPGNFAEINKLSSCIVKCSHIEELVAEQENMIFKLAPTLNTDSITLTTFNKMRVNKATSLYNRDVSSALQFIGEECQRSEYKVTALFIEIVSKWFNIITSRFSSISLGKIEGQEESQRKFEQTIEFFKSVIDLFHNIKIGQHGKFKPVQCGIMITTTSFIELTTYLINHRAYLYVLGARFTQDCIENLFSNIRKKFPVPNALQFKQCLKIHSVSQYLQILKNTNYEQDEGAFVVNFLKPRSRTKNDCNTYEIPVIPPHIDNKEIHMDNINLNILYSISGYVIHKLSKLPTVCESCINSAGSKTFDPNIKYSNLVHLRCFKSKTLFFVNTSTYNYFHDMEIIIRRYLPYMKNKNYDLLTFFTGKMANLRCDILETCCNLFKKIMKRFIMFRIKIDCKKGRLSTKVYNSKTMARHASIT